MLQTIFDTAARNDLWVVPGCFFCGCKSIFSSVFVQNTPKNMGGGYKSFVQDEDCTLLWECYTLGV